MADFKHLKLYHAPWSFCSQMVRIALHEKGIPYESNKIKLCDQYPEGENLSPEYLAINPKGVVPAIDIDGEIVTESTNIIKRINSLKGQKDINLWPKEVDQESLEKWVEGTTMTEGVSLGESFGTTIPPFSLVLINHMIKKYLSVGQALKVFWRHPMRDRGTLFLLMKFLPIHKRVIPLHYQNFVDGLIAIEAELEKNQPYFIGPFSHVDVNLMACFHRLTDIKLEEILEMDEFPKVSQYWRLLKSRDSYKEGILDFYGEKEHGDIKDVFKKKRSEHLEPLKELIRNSKP